MISYCVSIYFLAVCSANLTVVFAVDGSYKMGEARFRLVGDFITNISRNFDIDINKTWFITAVEGNGTYVYKTRAELNNFLGLYFPNTSQVVLGKALDSVRYQLSDNETRRDVPVVVLVIASHKSDDDIAVSAISLKKWNATLIAVGIGDEISPGQMREIASDPDSDYFVECNGTNCLFTKSMTIARTICQGKHNYVRLLSISIYQISE